MMFPWYRSQGNDKEFIVYKPCKPLASPTIATSSYLDTAYIKQKRMAFATMNEGEVERHSSRVTDDLALGSKIFYPTALKTTKLTGAMSATLVLN